MNKYVCMNTQLILTTALFRRISLFSFCGSGRGGGGAVLCNDDAVVVYVLIVFKIFIIEVLTTLLQTSN